MILLNSHLHGIPSALSNARRSYLHPAAAQFIEGASLYNSFPPLGDALKPFVGFWLRRAPGAGFF
ncbi:MAG: hypothetical protein ACXWDN_20990, partial [Limisphaerales bacterium]